MTLHNHHSALAIRNALIRVFVLPHLSSSSRHAIATTRNVHFGSTAELTQEINQRKQVIRKPALHPDIIESDFFPTVCLVPDDSKANGLQARTPLPQLRHRLRAANAKRTSVSEHEHIIMLKNPRYRPGQEPSPVELRNLQAPRSLINMLEGLMVDRAPNSEMAQRSRGRLRLPIPVEEPLVKIMTGAELMKYRAGQERIEKDAARRERQEKEIELSWTVKDNDLVWSLNKIKQWLSEGIRVTVKLTRKRRWLSPEPDVCMNLLNKIREAISNVPEVHERNISKTKNTEDDDASQDPSDPASLMRGLGNTMILSFTPKTKASTLTDAVSFNVPWILNIGKLQKHLEAITSALRKGRNIRITLGNLDASKMSSGLSQKTIFTAVRSECRQAKDVRIKRVQGAVDDASGTVVIEVTGGISNASTREIEVCADLESKDAEIRYKWINEWLKLGLGVNVWVAPGCSADELEQFLKKRLPHVTIAAGETDAYGQQRLMLSPLPEADRIPSISKEVAANRKSSGQDHGRSADLDMLTDLATRPPSKKNIENASLRSKWTQSQPRASFSPSPSQTSTLRQRSLASQNSDEQNPFGQASSSTPGDSLDNLLKSVTATSRARTPQRQVSRRW